MALLIGHRSEYAPIRYDMTRSRKCELTRWVHAQSKNCTFLMLRILQTEQQVIRILHVLDDQVLLWQGACGRAILVTTSSTYP